MRDDAYLVPVTTVIPKTLHRAVRAYCRTHTMTVMQFLAEAVLEKLRRSRGPESPSARSA